jgi:hypothetical protein
LFVLTTILSSNSFSLAAAEQDRPYRRVVIPLENILIHGIPAANRSLFDAKEVMSVDGTKKLYFVARPLARELITELIKADYDVKIVSALPANVAPKLLNSITLPALGDRPLSQLVGFEPIDFQKPINVNNFSKDGKATLFVAWDGLTASPRDRVISLGPVYFIYPDFKVLEQHRIASGDLARYFPKTLAQWETERKKLGRLSIILREANQGSLGAFQDKLKELFAEDQLHLTRIGSQMLGGTFKPTQVRWDIDASGAKVVGCQNFETRHNKPLGSASLELCQAQLGVIHVFKKDIDQHKVLACERRTTDGKAVIAESMALDACMQDNSEIVFAWEGITKKTCRAFTKQGDEIKATGGENCSKHYSLYNQKARRWIVFAAFAGMDSLSEDQIFRLVINPPPTKDAPLRLYEPWNDQQDAHASYSRCLVNGFQTMKLAANGNNLANECRADTLYSWGDQAKIDALKKLIGNLPKWRPIKTLYTSRGPIATFAYGPIPIRIKLMPDVRFVKSDYVRCDFDAANHRNTIYFRNSGDYSDWTFCDPNVIHSWSHSTAEHYDEIVKDVRLHDSLRKRGQRLAGYIEIYDSRQSSNVFFNETIDGHLFALSTFLGYLAGLQTRIQKGMGEIFYNPTLSGKEMTRENHFKTAMPTHFNEM